MHRVAFLLFGLLSLAPLTRAGEPLEISMVQLLANPDKFDGKRIRVIGFLRLEFEGKALFLHKEDFRESIFKNAVWVDVLGNALQMKQSGHYVVAEGTFDAKDHGHLDAFSGCIKKVTVLTAFK